MILFANAGYSSAISRRLWTMLSRTPMAALESGDTKTPRLLSVPVAGTPDLAHRDHHLSIE